MHPRGPCNETTDELLRCLICRLLGCAGHHPPRPKPNFLVYLRFGTYSVTFEGNHMASDLPDDKTASATVTPLDAKGNPAQVEAGSAVWTSSDESVATVVADPTNELGATVTPVGPLGSAQIKMECDADLGAGVQSIAFLGDINVIAGQAVGGTIAFTVNP